MGFVPCGSYSYASKNYKRWFLLAGHALWMTFVWGSFTAILTWSIPRELSRMFAKGEGYLNICEPMLKYSNALGFIVGGRFCGVSFLQSLQKGLQSTLLSLTSHFLSIIVFAFVLYYTDKTDGVRIIWCYSLAHAFGLVLSIIFLFKPVLNMYKDYKLQLNEKDMSIEEIYEDNIVDQDKNSV
ncbi:hypothetical protein TRFO_26070 [Tritrichomonas foetus]|uniref:Uncharacterized protein n=1 Tax=Tritrichomonas foetus TaxID=1144522 RepID=A0A1J4K560_9EUKA|nr:hypothetical protein TRFO_26070 [Tritrichomonas foetus]|eukprot:OHT06000.1 hypothetical protein TRFO_26070 [Tritrichomonas foetus]